MAIENGFDVRELEELNDQFLRMAQVQYPQEAKTFLREQANVARKKLRANTKAATKKKTGNLLRGIDRGPVHKYQNDFQIRVYNRAPHAHLIEHGHSNVKKKASSGSKGKIPTGTPVQMVPGREGPIFIGGGKEIFVEGKYVAAKTVMEMKESFPEAADKFVDELLDKGLG